MGYFYLLIKIQKIFEFMEIGQVENAIYPRIILGLDISTACIGVSIVKDTGNDKPEILYLSHK